MTEVGVYTALAAPFERVFTDTRGGVTFDYVNGEQVASRLNEALGPDGWAFIVKEHGLNAEADEMWVLGRLEALGVAREQFGSQKVKRSRSTGMPLDIGFDLKGATTDAFKKAASLLGVGLYLSHKEGQPARAPAIRTPRSTPTTKAPPPPEEQEGQSRTCVECGQVITSAVVEGKDWSVQKIVATARHNFDRVLCLDCLRVATAARRAIGAKA